MPGNGMSMWPRLFLWLIIIERCWPGVHRPQTHKESARKGGGMQKIGENYFFIEICAIVPSTRQFGYKKKGAFRVHTREEVPKTIFLTAAAKFAA